MKLRDKERARLHALIAEQPEGDPAEGETPADTPADTPTEPADETPPDTPPDTADEPPDDDPPPEPAPNAAADPPKKERRSNYWEALRSMEDRQKQSLTDFQRQQDDRLNALMSKLEQMAPKPEPKEVDPEVEAWDGAWKETADKFISPELQRLKQEQFMDRLDMSMELGRVKHADYEELVGDIQDPANELAKYLQANEDEAKKVFGARNPGEAIYQKAKYLRDATPEAREKWRETEKSKLMADWEAEKAKLLADFKNDMAGIISKGKNGVGVKPDSMVSATNGTGGQAGRLSHEAIKRMRDKRALGALIARGEGGEEIG